MPNDKVRLVIPIEVSECVRARGPGRLCLQGLNLLQTTRCDYDRNHKHIERVDRRETASTHRSCFEDLIIFAPVRNRGAVPELRLLVRAGGTRVRSSQNGERYLRRDLAGWHASGVRQKMTNLRTFRLVPVDVDVGST